MPTTATTTTTSKLRENGTRIAVTMPGQRQPTSFWQFFLPLLFAGFFLLSTATATSGSSLAVGSAQGRARNELPRPLLTPTLDVPEFAVQKVRSVLQTFFFPELSERGTSVTNTTTASILV